MQVVPSTHGTVIFVRPKRDLGGLQAAVAAEMIAGSLACPVVNHEGPFAFTQPSMPPKRVRVRLVAFSTRLDPHLKDRLDRFAQQHDTTAQATIHEAIREYLARRGS